MSSSTSPTATVSSAAMNMIMASNTSTSSSSMSMSMECSMSMLWNWNSKDVCFLSSNWKTSSKSLFGGTCVGVFLLLIVIMWWRRLLFEYQQQIVLIRKGEVAAIYNRSDIMFDSLEEAYINTNIPKNNYVLDLLIPLAETFKHKWMNVFNSNLSVIQGDKVLIYPSLAEHILYSIGDTIEWSVHHIIMLLFMYFNGYVFISAMIGAGVGWLLFNYKSCGVVNGGEVNRRCCL